MAMITGTWAQRCAADADARDWAMTYGRGEFYYSKKWGQLTAVADGTTTLSEVADALTTGTATPYQAALAASFWVDAADYLAVGAHADSADARNGHPQPGLADDYGQVPWLSDPDEVAATQARQAVADAVLAEARQIHQDAVDAEHDHRRWLEANDEDEYHAAGHAAAVAADVEGAWRTAVGVAYDHICAEYGNDGPPEADRHISAEDRAAQWRAIEAIAERLGLPTGPVNQAVQEVAERYGRDHTDTQTLGQPDWDQVADQWAEYQAEQQTYRDGAARAAAAAALEAQVESWGPAEMTDADLRMEASSADEATGMTAAQLRGESGDTWVALNPGAGWAADEDVTAGRVLHTHNAVANREELADALHTELADALDQARAQLAAGDVAEVDRPAHEAWIELLEAELTDENAVGWQAMVNTPVPGYVAAQGPAAVAEYWAKAADEATRTHPTSARSESQSAHAEAAAQWAAAWYEARRDEQRPAVHTQAGDVANDTPASEPSAAGDLSVPDELARGGDPELAGKTAAWVAAEAAVTERWLAAEQASRTAETVCSEDPLPPLVERGEAAPQQEAFDADLRDGAPPRNVVAADAAVQELAELVAEDQGRGWVTAEDVAFARWASGDADSDRNSAQPIPPLHAEVATDELNPADRTGADLRLAIDAGHPPWIGLELPALSPDEQAIRAITRATDRWPDAWTSPPPVFNPNHGGFYHYPWQEDGAEVETDELSPADAAVHAAATADLSALQGATVDTVHINGSAITPVEEAGPVLKAASRTLSATETQRAVAESYPQEYSLADDAYDYAFHHGGGEDLPPVPAEYTEYPDAHRSGPAPAGAEELAGELRAELAEALDQARAQLEAGDVPEVERAAHEARIELLETELAVDAVTDTVDEGNWAKGAPREAETVQRSSDPMFAQHLAELIHALDAAPGSDLYPSDVDATADPAPPGPEVAAKTASWMTAEAARTEQWLIDNAPEGADDPPERSSRHAEDCLGCEHMPGAVHCMTEDLNVPWRGTTPPGEEPPGKPSAADAVAAAHTAVTADTHRAVEELDAQGARTAADRHAQLPDTAEQAPTMDAEAS